jgi:hypothetical protein
MGGFFERRIDPAVAIVVLVWLGVALGAPFAPMSFDRLSFLPPIAAGFGVAVISVVYTRLRPDPKLAAATRATALILLFSCGLAISNYYGFAFRRPLIDGALADLDAALGLDWWAYVTAVKTTPLLAPAMTVAYDTSLPQIVVAILALALTGRIDRLERFVFAFMIAAIVTVAIWCAYPNFGAYAIHFAAPDAPTPPFPLALGPDNARALLAMHGGTFPVVRFGEMIGLVGSPSFHTVMAVLTVWALRDVRVVGPLAIALNALVVAAVPADGGHHFVDAAAGGLVAVAALAAVRGIMAAPVGAPLGAPAPLGEATPAE